MRKTFIAALIAATSLACIVSCRKVELKPKITVQDKIEVPSEGGSFTITYEIVNPKGHEFEASTKDSWITDIDCSAPGSFTFSVAEYTDKDEPRTGSVEVTYGDASKSITVVQTAAPTYFDISVTDIGYTSFKVSVTPLDKDMTYAALVTAKEYFDGFDSEEALTDNVFEIWKESAEELEMPLNDYLNQILMKGDTKDMTTTDRYPGEEYAIFAFGVNYDMEVLTDLYTTIVRTEAVEKLNISYDITPEIDGADATIHVEPSDLEQSYYLDIITADKIEEASSIEYWQQLFIENIRLNRIIFGMTAEEVMGPNMHSGVSDTSFELSPNTAYAAVVMAASYDGIVFSDINIEEFSTKDANLSDNVINVEVTIIDSRKYNMTITPSNDDPYTWGTQSTSTFDGMNDEEILEYLLQDPFIGFNLVSGEISFEFGASPGDEYTAYAFGYENGVATTGLYKCDFKMPADDTGTAGALTGKYSAPKKITVLYR